MNSQTYNSGYLRVYEATDEANPGEAPKPVLKEKYGLRYEERSIGVTRAYLAMQTGNQIDLVLRCPRVPVSSLDIVKPNDGNLYRIDLIQYPADITPESMDLTLRRLDSIDGNQPNT